MSGQIVLLRDLFLFGTLVMWLSVLSGQIVLLRELFSWDVSNEAVSFVRPDCFTQVILSVIAW